MSDVTAVVLTTGEEATERAIDSVRKQSVLPEEIILIQNVMPFHKALNLGASRVRTEFFIQVDSDMILDTTCITDLRDCVSDGVGMVLGHVRDPLLGPIQAIKLFRTECFENVQLRDCVSSETEFNDDIVRNGWRMIYALKYSGDTASAWHTFGEHCPDYNPRYTFSKFTREGAKARYRKAGLWDIFHRLKASRNNAALIAIIAASHGIFVQETRDLHGALAESEEFQLVEHFLMFPENCDAPPIARPDLVRADLKNAFRRFFEAGIQLRQHRAASTFKPLMRQLHQDSSIASWVALVGLCHGLFFEEYREADAEEAFLLLSELLPPIARKDLSGCR